MNILYRISNALSHSVATRTTALVFALITLIMLPSSLWLIEAVRAVVKEQMMRQANRSMDGAINSIDNRIANVETAVHTAAAFADRTTMHETQCYELLYRLIGKNDDIAAVTLLYSENYFPHLGRYYAPTVARDPLTGQLEADEISGPENDFCYLETDSNWIYTHEHLDGYWCLPYVDSMSTKRAMVTYSVPLYDTRDSIYAVLCADVALDWVRDIVEDVKPYDFSRVTVISRDSQYVCHPNLEWVQTYNVFQQARERCDTSYLNLTHKMLSWQRGSDTLQEDFTLALTPHERARKESTIVYYAPIERIQWSVSFTFPEAKIMEGPNKLQAHMLFILSLMLVLISAILFLVIRAQVWPLRQLADATRNVAHGQFDIKLPNITTHDEIRHLRDSFEQMQGSLANYIVELQETTSSKAMIENELHVASSIQMSMLPKKFPPYPERDDIDIYGSLVPAKAVGGDLYDFYIRDEKLFFCIGDVSGKGVPASLVMAVTKSLFRTISAREARPELILSQVNDTLSDDNDSLMFVTLFIGVLDLPSGRLRYSNAGHDAPLLIGSGVGTLPCDSNVPAGVMPGWKYSAQEVLIYPQTTIFLYTDGLTEAENIDHQQFGKKRVVNRTTELLAEKDYTPHKLIDGIHESVVSFVDGAEQSDDMTMLAIQYTKQAHEELIRRSITLPNNIETVPELAQFVEEMCEAAGFDSSETMMLNLAMEEAVVNVMSYAYPLGTHGDILVEATMNDVRLKFIITDSGKPFDPTAKADTDISLPAEDRPIGGLGIHLVRQIMDSINYERLSGKNVLTLRKQLKKNKKTEEL